MLSLLSRLLNQGVRAGADADVELSVLSLLSRLLNRFLCLPRHRLLRSFSALSVEPSAESFRKRSMMYIPGGTFSALSVEPSAESMPASASGNRTSPFSALSVEPSAESASTTPAQRLTPHLSVLSLLSRLLNLQTSLDAVHDPDFQCSLC